MDIGDKIKYKVGKDIREGVIISIDYANIKTKAVESMYTMYEPSSDSYGLVLPMTVVDVVEHASGTSKDDPYKHAMSIV